MEDFMRFGKREVRRRLIGFGFTLPVVGGGANATWSVSEADKTTACSALNFLEDRRVLYDPYEVEIAHRCVSSVREIREHLRHVIGQCQTDALRDPLRAIQAACRQFLTDVQATERDGRYLDIMQDGTPSWLFNQAVGALRGRVGTSVAVIAVTFDVDVDEHLGKILPPVVDDEADDRSLQPPRRQPS
jgi:hypothetical protein